MFLNYEAANIRVNVSTSEISFLRNLKGGLFPE
jgi:hypothetical protein